MTINVYRFDDPSAPTLTGQVGSLTTLLDAILVNGYGAKTAAGWAIAFSGTNTRAYRAASGNRMFLAVDDSNPSPGSYGAQAARITSYESMSSAILGTKPSPNAGFLNAQGINGIGLLSLKSQAADATQRPWIAFVSETFIHLQIIFYSTIAVGFNNTLGGTYVGGFMFGDLVNQQKAGDAYATILIGGGTTSPSNSYTGATVNGTTPAPMASHYIQRPYHQANNCIQFLKGFVGRGSGGSGSNIGGETGAPNYPDPITGGFQICEIWAFEMIASNASARGRIPGLYHPAHNTGSVTAPFNTGDVIAGSGALAGTSFMFCQPGNNGVGLMQVTGTW